MGLQGVILYWKGRELKGKVLTFKINEEVRTNNEYR
jgi:hypothetical protein